MLVVSMMGNNKVGKKIPIHWLHSQAYCEYQIYLEYVRGVEVEPTIEMRIGKNVHLLLEEEHEKKAELKLTVENAIKKAQEEKIVLVGREIPVIGNRLYGSIDEAHFMPDQIVIIDDKPNSVPFLSNKQQVWGYCLAFQEQFNPDIPIVACLRHRDTQEIIWKELFSEEQKNMVLESIERVLGIINKEITPKPTDNVNKCRNCKLRDDCDVYNIGG